MGLGQTLTLYGEENKKIQFFSYCSDEGSVTFYENDSSTTTLASYGWNMDWIKEEMGKDTGEINLEYSNEYGDTVEGFITKERDTITVHAHQITGDEESTVDFSMKLIKIE